MQECDLSQSLARIGDVLDLFSGSAERVFDAAIEDRVEYVFFAFEVEIDGAVCNARFASDVGANTLIAARRIASRLSPTAVRTVVSERAERISTRTE
jgi:hypothetical protein